MTVSTGINETVIRYDGTGGATFTYPFKIFDTADLVVVITDTVNSIDYTLVLNDANGYTVTENVGSDGGSITLQGTRAALSSDWIITIYRSMELTQETVYTEGDNFPAQSHEDALDKLTMIAQQLNEILDRTVQLPLSSSLTELTLPAPVAGKVLAWNSSEDGLVNADGLTLGTVVVSGMTVAGFVKNTIAGVLQGGNSIVAGDLPASSKTAQGAAELATSAECLTGTDDLRIVTPAGMKAAIDDRGYVTGGAELPYAVLQNRQTQNTGGGTATTGSWLIVPLNTEFEDADTIVNSTSLPAFSLAAGTYRIEAMIPFWRTNSVQTRLYNVTDVGVQQNVASIDMMGQSIYSNSDTINSNLIGTYTIAGTKQFRIEYYCNSTVATNGHGYPSNFGVEVYAQVQITKIA